MNAITLLKEQHEEVQDLFGRIEKARGKEQKQRLFQKIANSLAAHATIEEQLFYPAAYAKKTKAILAEAVEEHLAMKRIIADLLNMSPSDENFDAKVKVLKEQVEHHVEEEEGPVFKAARQEIDSEELDRLGDQMKELFDAEMQGEPSDAIPEQTSEAAPLH